MGQNSGFPFPILMLPKQCCKFSTIPLCISQQTTKTRKHVESDSKMGIVAKSKRKCCRKKRFTEETQKAAKRGKMEEKRIALNLLTNKLQLNQFRQLWLQLSVVKCRKQKDCLSCRFFVWPTIWVFWVIDHTIESMLRFDVARGK